jgi:hypothetical protein
MSMVSIQRAIVFCWISCWNIALNYLRKAGRRTDYKWSKGLALGIVHEWKILKDRDKRKAP